MSNQGFILIHSTTVHIKDQKRTLRLQTTITKNNQKLHAYGVGGRETSNSNVTVACCVQTSTSL